MKISVIILAVCLFSGSAFGQVGINTQTPAATLDVAARTTGTSATTAEGLIAPRLTIADLNAKASAYGTAQAGSLIYVTDAANDTPSGQTANINAVGYYFFDGTGWLKVNTGNAGNSNDIYNGDGALSANRTVALSDKTLAFTANPTTGTSHFTVDDTTLSVDALNNRVGIGTNAPVEKMHIENGNVFIKNEHPALYFQATATPPFYQNFNVDYGTLMFYRNVNAPANGMYIRHMNEPIGYPNGSQLQFGVLNNGTYSPVMNITNLSKQVLIGTNTIPTYGDNAKLIINNGTTNGAVQIIDGTQGNNKVLTSNDYGLATWKAIPGLVAPSTTYTWDNSGAGGGMPTNQSSVYGPYTVGKTGWYQIQSRWRYMQSPPSVSGGDSGAGTVWMQINTSGTNNMYALSNPSLLNQPAEEISLFNVVFPKPMMSDKMVYLTSGTNYYVHISTFVVDRLAEQKLILNYVQ